MKTENSKSTSEFKIVDATILSLEENATYKDVIPPLEGSEATCWWLRSPGCDSHYAATVCSNGIVNESGHDVLYPGGGVRPAFLVSVPDTSAFDVGDKIQLPNTDYNCTVLDKGDGGLFVLADKIVDCRMFDTESNNWQTSRLKNWLTEYKNQYFKNTDQVEEQENEHDME